MTGHASNRFGPWSPDIDAAERKARVRSLRALALLLIGPTSPIVTELRAAEHDREALGRALVEVDRLGALPRRRLLAAYAALSAPERSARG